MAGVLATAPLQKQRRRGLRVTSSSSSRKPQPDLAHSIRDMSNSKNTLQSQDRILEIPTAAPFAVALARAGV
jgi:hypothetical protein